MNKHTNVIIVHPHSNKPQVTFEASPYCKENSFYILGPNEKYTIDKTDQQKDDYIWRLEKMVNDLRMDVIKLEDKIYEAARTLGAFVEREGEDE